MLIIVSPSKDLNLESPLVTSRYTQPALQDEAAELVKIAKQRSPAQLASLMKISDRLALLNAQRFNDWQLPFTPENARPAALTFAGDVYTGLQAETFSEGDFDFAQQHLRILSGLYGLLRPLDLMQPYRLEMGIKLENRAGKDLYSFWRERVTSAINQALKQQKDEMLINLASDEYFKAIDIKKLQAKIIRPVFMDEKNGQYKVISFYAKKARGLMSRFIIKERLTQPTQLKAFNLEGYLFDGEDDKGNMVFKRPQNT